MRGRLREALYFLLLKRSHAPMTRGSFEDFAALPKKNKKGCQAVPLYLLYYFTLAY